MKKSILILSLISCLSIQAQNVENINTLYDSLTITIPNAYSNLGKTAFYQVDKKDTIKHELSLVSILKTDISQVEERVVFNLTSISDVFSIPMGSQEFKVIVNLKESVIVLTKTIEHENLFHKEIIKEDISESNDLWFTFTDEKQAKKFESTVIYLQKQFTQQ